MRGPKELITRPRPSGTREARRGALAPSWAVVTRLCWRESAQRAPGVCGRVWRVGAGVRARVCVRGAPLPWPPDRCLRLPGPPLSGLSESVSTTVSSLSGRASLRFPTCFSVCLRCPSLTHSSLASTSRTRVSLEALEAAAPGAQLSSQCWGLRQLGRRWRAGTGSVAAPEPEAAPPPTRRAWRGEERGQNQKKSS